VSQPQDEHEVILRHGRLGPAVRVGLVAAVLAALATGIWRVPVVHDPAGPAALHPEWWVIAAIALASELAVLHIQVRREAQAVSLGDLALVPALFFASSGATIIGWSAAALLVSLWRRQSLLKLAFNLALSSAGAAVAVLVFHGLHAFHTDVDPLGWVAALAATASVCLLDTVAVLVVIALVEGDVHRDDVFREAARGLATTGITTTVALVAVHAVDGNVMAVVPVTVGIALLIVGYRTYGALAERHLALERIHRVSRVLSGTPETDELLTRLLHQTRDVMLADQVQLAFIAAEADEPALRVTLDPAEGVRRSRLPVELTADPVWQRVVEDGDPVVVARGTRDLQHQAFLRICGLDDAVLVPLRGDTGIVGAVIAGNRMGEVRSFDEHDLRLLATIADQAGAALHRGELADRLRHEAEHDSLTGLPNRMLLHRRLAEASSSVRSGTLRGFAVVLVNLVDFRAVNEALGHTVGDHILHEIAQRLSATGRPGDVVARLGGDEFALLLSGVHDPDTAMTLARRARAALQQPMDVAGIDVEIGAWAGVAVCPLHGTDAEIVLQHAESALAAARREKVEVQLHTSGADAPADPARLALLGELRNAIQADQLALFVQPQADTRTGRVVSVEALVRWRHPVRGLVGPADFIPFAERTGLVHPLTAWMLARAVAACGGWLHDDAVTDGPGLNIAVNLSARSILDPQLPRAVETLLHLHRLPATDLTLEITESSVLEDPRRTREVLERLRALGIRISIDDFGTGYSSMSYLRDLPADEVKIDRTFVADMLERPGDEAIVHSIVTLAGNLGLETVAEGVEDEATWQRLAEMGCTRIQGYHLARPMPHEELVGWLADHARQGRAPLLP
jgi:diguanylate cyclase (GGDEF)-like protein